MRRFICALAMVGLSGLVCAGPDPSMKEATLAKFNSAEEMLTYLRDQAVLEDAERRGNYAYEYSDVAQAAPPTSADDAYSTTNLQEAGVDESDVVKNDGTYIYILKNSNRLRIVQAVPADALAVVGQMDIPAWCNAMYLAGDRILLLGGKSGVASAVILLIDVSDRAQPVIQQTWELDGTVAASRLIGEKLHVVLQEWPSPQRDASGEIKAWDSLDPVLPSYRIAVGSDTIREGKLLDWSQCYHPIEAEGYDLTVITTLDLSHPQDEPAASGITAATGIVYASPTSLYLTSTQGGWWFSRRSFDTTRIHKFDLTGDRAIYVGGAEVPGHLNDQFSMGEQDGYLRLGSTVGHVSPFGGSAAINAVYVLDREAIDGKLATVGKVEDIAPGEQIYSARFIGDRGFLVTFKKVDPLYTVDLSDPTSPQIVGQLKVPGYSDYIHPLDADHLLTIGKDALDVGNFAWFQGVQLSIFDVSDFANPQLLAKEVIGVRGTESPASSNPKAFNYFAPQEALAIPIWLAEGPTSAPNVPGTFTFSGLYVYHVSVTDGFGLLGRISTGTGGQSYWQAPYESRGVFIGDAVYAVTGQTVVAASAVDPTQVLSSVTIP